MTTMQAGRTTTDLYESVVSVDQEIPKRYHDGGYQLRHIEIDLELPAHRPDDQQVHKQPDQGNDEKPRELHHDVGIGTVKGPNAVHHVIGGRSQRKTAGVRNIFLDLQDLLADKGSAEINEHP